MKLIFCEKCKDIVLLRSADRKCECGSSGGRYTDEINAVVYGHAIPLGITNISFVQALRNRPEAGMGIEFTAFVMPKSVLSVTEKNAENRRAYETIMQDVTVDLTYDDLYYNADGLMVALLTYKDRRGIHSLYVTQMIDQEEGKGHFYSVWSDPKGWSAFKTGSDRIANTITELYEHLSLFDGALIELV